MRLPIYITLLFSFVFSSIEAEIFISHEKHAVRLAREGGYINDVFLTGRTTEKDEYTIYYQSLENISNISVEISHLNGAWKKVKNKTLKVEDIHSAHFYTGAKKYTIELEKDDQFKISYSIASPELKVLSSSYLAGGYKTDSTLYAFSIPFYYVFEWNIGKLDSSLVLKIDTIKSTIGTDYSIRVYNPTRADLCYSKIYHSIHKPGLSLTQDLNNWEWKLVQQNDGIDDVTFNALKPSRSIQNDTLNYTWELFNSVRKKISYIAIEAGYGAWQPRPANTIFQNKKGDCKDMANVIYQCLKKSGVECYLAMILAISTKSDLNIPVQNNFNHMICVAFINQQWICLDATDDSSPFLYPSQHTQGRTAFCISKDQAFEVKIPVIPIDSNLIRHHFDLSYSDGSVSGIWKIAYHGYPAADIKEMILGTDPATIKLNMEHFLGKLLTKYTITDIIWSVNNLEQLSIEAKVKLSGQILLHTNEKDYFSLSCLPKPINLNLIESKCYWYKHTTSNIEITSSVSFPFDASLKNTFSSELMEENATFHMTSSQENKNTIKFQYNYKNPNLEFNSSQYASMQKLNKSIEKIFKTIQEIIK